MKILAEDPTNTQKALAQQIGKSERTIKTRIAGLQEKGYIRRANGKRFGKWEILVELNA